MQHFNIIVSSTKILFLLGYSIKYLYVFLIYALRAMSTLLNLQL
jgi:hypothetical protein